MTGAKIIKLFNDTVIKEDPSLMQKVQVLAAQSQMQIHDIHSRAIACHCECMGMEIENTLAIIDDTKPPYMKQEFNFVMQKWGLVDEGNQSII